MITSDQKKKEIVQKLINDKKISMEEAFVLLEDQEKEIQYIGYPTYPQSYTIYPQYPQPWCGQTTITPGYSSITLIDTASASNSVSFNNTYPAFVTYTH